MDLDDRAARAASALRQQVEPALDINGARHAVARGAARRRSRRSVTGVVLAVTVAAALAVLAVQSFPEHGDDDRMAIDTERSPSDRSILGDMPRSPIDGRASWRLPVLAEPQSGVEDGDTITMYARGFEPGENVGVVMCAREAEMEGAGACMIGDADYVFAHVTPAYADSDGSVVQEFPVRRHITTPVTGPVDCASEAERCIVALGAETNYDRSGGTYINFAGAPPFPQPSLVVTPEGPYAAGQTVHVEAHDLIPGRLNQVQQCAGDVCVPLMRGFSSPDGTFAADVIVNSVVYEGGVAVECADRCTLELTGVGIEGATAAPFPEPVGLGALAGPPLPEDQVPPPSTPVPEGEPEIVPVPEGGPSTTAASVPDPVPPSTGAAGPPDTSEVPPPSSNAPATASDSSVPG